MNWLHPIKHVKNLLELAPERVIDIALLLFIIGAALVLAFAPHFVKTAVLIWFIF